MQHTLIALADVDTSAETVAEGERAAEKHNKSRAEIERELEAACARAEHLAILYGDLQKALERTRVEASSALELAKLEQQALLATIDRLDDQVADLKNLLNRPGF